MLRVLLSDGFFLAIDTPWTITLSSVSVIISMVLLLSSYAMPCCGRNIGKLHHY